MPYTQIYWVKLKLELLNDKRFIFDCTEDQRLLFLGLILLAGATRNETPDDANYINNRLNLHKTPEETRKNLDFLFKIFPKTVSVNGHIKFRNFSDLHNQIRDSQRIAKGSIEQNRIEKNRIEQILASYFQTKNYPIKNPDGSKNSALISSLYKRSCKAAKELALMDNSGGKDAVDCIAWFGGVCDKKGLSWSLETVVKHFPDYLVKGKDENAIPESMRKYLKGAK